MSSGSDSNSSLQAPAEGACYSTGENGRGKGHGDNREEAGRQEQMSGNRVACVRFAPSQGPRLRAPGLGPKPEGGSLWAGRPLLMERKRGTYLLVGTAEEESQEALVQWILSHGSAAGVEGPPWLRRRVAQEARAVLDHT